MPCLSRLWLKLWGEQGSSPEGVDDLCFHTYGEFSPPPLLLELGLEARIWASRLGSGPQCWDLGLKAGIWALRLRSESEGGWTEEEEKIPNMCESLCHRPLWGRCPASSSTSTTTYLGMTRVPLTI